jgi:hypothetical protein
LFNDTLKYAQLTGARCRMIGAWTRTLRGPAMVKKIVTWALVVFVVFYLLTDPNGAAHFVSNVLDGLKSAGRSLSTFVSKL